jgi:hypothetical protein
MERKPADFTIFKKGAVIQFSLKEGSELILRNKRGDEYLGTSKGCVFLAIAPASDGDKKYDWSQKIAVALSEHDIARFMVALKGRETVEFVHDPGAGSSNAGKEVKSLRVSPNEKGGVWVNLAIKEDGKLRKVPGMPLSEDECLAAYSLLNVAIPKVLGWDQ